MPANVNPETRAVQRKLHQTIKRITADFQGRWHFNTSIAALMELVNTINAAPGFDKESSGQDEMPRPFKQELARSLVLMLAPFAPYLAHELWETLGEKGSLLRAEWPKCDPVLAKEDEIEIPVQVSGKLRSRITVPADSPDAFVQETAFSDEKIKALIGGKQIVKVIIVPGKLVNIVVR